MEILKRPTNISQKRDLKSFKGPVHAKVTNFYRFTKIISDVPKNGEIENFRMKLGKPEKFICASGDWLQTESTKCQWASYRSPKLTIHLFPKFPWLSKLITHLYLLSQLHIVLSKIWRNPKNTKRNIPKLGLFIRKMVIEFYRCKPYGLFDYDLLFVIHYCTFWFISTFVFVLLFGLALIIVCIAFTFKLID